MKREHYISSLGYLGEDEDYAYYFKMDIQPDDYYETVRLPQGVSELQRKAIFELALYKRLKKYVRSIRFWHFKPDRKQICLAAICEIIEDLIATNNHASGEMSNNFRYTKVQGGLR